MEFQRLPNPPVVGRTARLLGGAGLLPQLGAVLLQARYHGDAGAILAFGYASLILSFLGGMWWGFAMHRTERQRVLAAVAVIPSLVPVALAPLVVVLDGWRWPLIGVAVALMLTLLVDLRLVERGDAPDKWMGLRVPLSCGLALLTVIAALVR